MANKKISELNSVTTPLAGTEEIAVVQSGETKKGIINNIRDYLKTYFDTLYQATLVSGTNIKTVNGNSLLGSGNVVINEVTADNFWTYQRGDFYMCQATGGSLNNIGYTGNPSLVGTGVNVPANLSSSYSTSPYETWTHRRQTSATSAGSHAESYWAYKLVSVGLGFYASAKVNVTMTTNGRFFFGLSDSISAFTNVNPSTLTNIVGFGIDSLDTNLQILHNDNTGTATKVDLGASFSINSTSNNTYIVEMWNYMGSSTTYFRVRNLLTNVTSSIVSVTTDLPTVTDGLAFRLWANNGTDTSAIVLHFSNHTLLRQS